MNSLPISAVQSQSRFILGWIRVFPMKVRYNTRMDPIQIFKEYDTLRSEIITRTNCGYQLLALGSGSPLHGRPLGPLIQCFLFPLGLSSSQC